MKLQHRQLEAFRALVDTGSVTDAAKRINVTQPAASRLISDLEHSVGYQLFLREKKRLYPTPEALALYEEVNRSFIGIDTIAEAARDIGNFRRGSLRLVSLPAMALSFLPRIIAKFCQDRPDISVSMQIEGSPRVIQCVASQQYDFGLAELGTEHPGVTTKVLHDAPLVAVLPLGHELLSREILTPKDFEGQSFVSLGRDNPRREQLDALFVAYNVTRKVQIEAQLSMALGNMVASGAGLSIIDKITACDLRDHGLIDLRPFEPQIPYRYRVLLPKHKPLSSLGEAFLAMVDKELKEDPQRGAK